MDEFDENTPLFVISVAAELALMHPQTLRQYDRLGLVSPGRTLGQSRRYTMRNVAQLRQIAALSAEGVSLEGIKRILELENNNAELKQRVRDLEQALANEPITVFGNGKQTRDFTYIDDTVESCIRLMNTPGSHIVNIANEEEWCIEDLAHSIKKVTNSNSEVIFIEAPKKRYDYGSLPDRGRDRGF